MGKVKGLLVMDVDSTLIQEEVIDLLGNQIGFGEQIAEITEKAMNGELDFEAALKARVALLKGLPETIFDTVYHQIHFQKGAKELVDYLHAKDYKIGLVSGGFHETVDRLARELGIDYVTANRLEIVEGSLSGQVTGPIVTKEVKVQKLQEWAHLNHLPLSATIAMGDGANDLPMIHKAGLGVAFCAKELVRQEAPNRIDVADLTALIPLIEKRENDNESH